MFSATPVLGATGLFDGIAPGDFFVVAGAILLFGVLPLALLSLWRQRHARRRLRRLAQVWNDTAHDAEEYQRTHSRTVARRLRTALDERKVQETVLSAIVAQQQAEPTSTALQELVAESSVPGRLADQLVNGDAEDRVHTLELMADLRLGGDLVGIAVQLVDAADEDVRRAAIRALAALAPSATVGALTRVAEADRGWASEALVDAVASGGRGLRATLLQQPSFVRHAPDLLAWLPQTGQGAPVPWTEEDVVPALTVLVAADDQRTRLAAVAALGRLGSPASLSALYAALGCEDRLVRYASASLLRGTPRGTALLRWAEEHEEGSARETAAAILWGMAHRPKDTVIDLTEPATAAVVGERTSERVDAAARAR